MLRRKKNRAIQVRLVDTNDKREDATPGEDKVIHPETVKLIAERGKEVVKHVAIAVVTVYAAVKLIDTLSEIAIKKTKSADNQED